MSPSVCDLAPERSGIVEAVVSPLVRAVLERAGVPLAIYRDARRLAEATGSDAAEELIARGDVDAETLAFAIASVIGAPFGTPKDGDRAIGPVEEGGSRHLRTCTLGLEAKLFVAPRLESFERTAALLAGPAAGRMVVTTTEALRAHRARRSVEERLSGARLSLAAERPEWSARSVLSARQGYVLGLATLAAVFAVWTFGASLPTGFRLVISFFFCACTLFRLLILLDLPAERRRKHEERESRENGLRLPVGPLPVYTVLVALYREEEMIDPLVDALARINWPRSRLDVKLVCEADDAATVSAVKRRIAGEAGFELVEVPPSAPRTKPKALNHALPLSRGDFVVLYDAEDRPDPDQLLEAWLTFSAEGHDLACVQAPLVIRNGRKNWLTGLFALEYAVLFRALLPFLARRRLPIPLGGTSNHFRREILSAIGGWDSHNVAEDADLGMRLARLGYRTDVISAPTSEIAPERLVDWRNQRSRWIKGWIQTYLVHMRRPVIAYRELGAVRMVAFQMLFMSMVASALMHTAFVVYVALAALDFALDGSATIPLDRLMLLDIFNIVAANLVFAALAAGVVEKDERPMMRCLWALWAYWFLVSVAAFRSVRQLFADPHGWEKTPHHEARAKQE